MDHATTLKLTQPPSRDLTSSPTSIVMANSTEYTPIPQETNTHSTKETQKATSPVSPPPQAPTTKSTLMSWAHSLQFIPYQTATPTLSTNLIKALNSIGIQPVNEFQSKGLPLPPKPLAPNPQLSTISAYRYQMTLVTDLSLTVTKLGITCSWPLAAATITTLQFSETPMLEIT